MPKVAIFFPSSLRDSLMHIFLEFTVEKKMSVIFIYTVMCSGRNTYKWADLIVSLICITITI